MPVTAFAGVFSFVSELFASEEETVELPSHNSQTLPVLQAVPNIKPNPVDHTPDLVISSDSVLESYTGPLGTPLEIEEHTSVSKVTVYKVRKGDTITGIAAMFGVNTNTITWANNGKKTVKEGDELTILPLIGLEYTVAKGDTLAGIAKKFKANADEIQDYNDLGKNLVAGTKIIIPDGEMSPTSVSTKTASVSNVAAPAKASGYFIRPAAGRLTQGPHGPNLAAVDIANKPGTAVVATAAGKVIVAKSGGGYNGGYGNYVVVEHDNGYQTLYAHLQSVAVSTGSYVAQGDTLGGMGMTGKATGNHVHYLFIGGPKGYNPSAK